MTVKEMIAELSKQPNDAQVLKSDEHSLYHSRVATIKFAWVKQVGSQFEERTSKVDDATKSAVVIW